ncbi:hypothetical protein METBIDRAFT_173224 [Metschnikowia bicuspidata var. bicuspidata NRRL YB-4993]|uniref:Uncharacterized protein n=1 Tax=Metschnikowia bicuspidata var. bicuspidata NRRL YB-4993 TaxID=869754 RepID=A0A1A0HB07_9ASCO|nr:hypothetical protein METBIDRAFT_173224 [Metschnikowia bicuspidata var. bicuspidata NRRL YB-4993]OBA21067.1 hypothetical protein METBIDRAFT_173224 [Metschnikowia bicuspidata var. bicuspidata NRRL YB-4993]
MEPLLRWIRKPDATRQLRRLIVQEDGRYPKSVQRFSDTRNKTVSNHSASAFQEEILHQRQIQDKRRYPHIQLQPFKRRYHLSVRFKTKDGTQSFSFSHSRGDITSASDSRQKTVPNLSASAFQEEISSQQSSIQKSIVESGISMFTPQVGPPGVTSIEDPPSPTASYFRLLMRIREA